MELLLYALADTVGTADHRTPDRVIHCARQAAGLMLAQQAADWKQLHDLPKWLGHGTCIEGSPDGIIVFAYKEFGVVARIKTNEKNGQLDGVVDVKWNFFPFDPNGQPFLRFRRNPSITVDVADDLLR